MQDDEHREIRLRTSRPGDVPGRNSGLRPGEKIGLLCVISGQLGIGTLLTVLACFWREPFLNVLIFYGVGSVALAALAWKSALRHRGSDETRAIGCWLGLWGLMGLPSCIAAFLISNWR
jgi:hypothetical protein